MTSSPPEQFVVPVPQISWIQGLPPFIVLSDVYDVPGIDMFDLTCITDSFCMLTLDWERTNPPPDPGSQTLIGSVTDAGPLIKHRLSVPAGSLIQQPRQERAQEVRFSIRLADADTSGRQLRPYIGTLKLRQQPWNFVPVRFYDFGDTPPPPPGGDEGDWNTYAWAQYNPSGQPFTRGPFAALDLNGTNGSETIPTLRVISRLVQPTGSTIAVQLEAPAPPFPGGLRTAVFSVYLSGVLRERFCWSVPAAGELEPIEAMIRATAESRLVRVARLIKNPGPTQTFLGPNYWLTTQAQTNLVAPA